MVVVRGGVWCFVRVLKLTKKEKESCKRSNYSFTCGNLSISRDVSIFY